MGDEIRGDPETQRFTLNIRVHIYPQAGRWYAASTDLVVMAEGSDEAEAEERFVAAAKAYALAAFERRWIDPLMQRPPILRRLEIRRRVAIAKLLRRHPTIRRRHLTFA